MAKKKKRGHREHNKVEQEVEDKEEVVKGEDVRREFAEFWLGEHTSGHYRSLSTWAHLKRTQPNLVRSENLAVPLCSSCL